MRCGIAEEDLPHIFDEFYQVARNKGTPEARGGMSMARAKSRSSFSAGSSTSRAKLASAPPSVCDWAILRVRYDDLATASVIRETGDGISGVLDDSASLRASTDGESVRRGRFPSVVSETTTTYQIALTAVAAAADDKADVGAAAEEWIEALNAGDAAALVPYYHPEGTSFGGGIF